MNGSLAPRRPAASPRSWDVPRPTSDRRSERPAPRSHPRPAPASAGWAVRAAAPPASDTTSTRGSRGGPQTGGPARRTRRGSARVLRTRVERPLFLHTRSSTYASPMALVRSSTWAASSASRLDARLTALSPRARLSRPPSRNCFCHLAIVVWLICSRRATSTWVVSPLSTESTIASFSSGVLNGFRPILVTPHRDSRTIPVGSEPPWV